LRQRRERGNYQQRGKNENALIGVELARRTHCQSRDAGADRREADIASKPLAKRGMTHKVQAQCGDGRSEQAARRGMQNASSEHDKKNGPAGDRDGAGADREESDQDHEPRGASGVDKGAGRDLTGQGYKTADRKNQTDIALVPGLRRQIDGDERTEAGLNVGQEEGEPIKPAHAAARGRGCRHQRRGRRDPRATRGSTSVKRVECAT
jgi:hypothetical protein